MMSDLSTSDKSVVSNAGYQNHTSSRPKFQPIRVKALLHFCESDDDESEDKPQDSDNDTDSDEPQPLPPDFLNEDTSNKLNECINNRSVEDDSQDKGKRDGTAHNVLHSNVPMVSEEPMSVNDGKEYKTKGILAETIAFTHNNHEQLETYKYEGIDHESHKSTSSANLQFNAGVKTQVNVAQCSTSSLAHENESVKADVSTNGELLNHLQLYSGVESEHYMAKPIAGEKLQEWNDLHVKDQYNSKSDPVPFTPQNCRSSLSSQSGISNLQCTNSKLHVLESKSSMSEDQSHHERNMCTAKSVTSDAGLILNSVDHLSMEASLKQTSVSTMRPTPSMSRKNMQTPQNKLHAEQSKNHRSTPGAAASYWPQNSIRQTPLHKEGMNMKDSMKTPKNSMYSTPCMQQHETPRYFGRDCKSVRRPLADAAGFMHNDVSNRRLLQSSQHLKHEEATPKHQNELCVNQNLNNKDSTMKKILEVSDTATQSEVDSNGQLKENRHPNVLDVLEKKEPVMQTKISESRHVSVSNTNLESKTNPSCAYEKDGQAVSKPVYSDSQSHSNYPAPTNQKNQQEQRPTVDGLSNVKFSVPSSISKAKHNQRLVVKGKEYLILGTLGQGMSGEVLRVQDLSSLELCAIKCVNLSRMDKDSAQGCLEEISMLHKLQAPCIVRMFDYEIKYPMVYVVMEMGDTDLSRLLKSMLQEKQLPLTMILYYWTEMITAVKHIHDNGVIHSDLKPANFLLVRGRLKLIDFGIASSINADMTSVVKNCPIGTLNYISPEALMDIGGNSDSPTHNVQYKISFKSDVWSLGCILYSLVYGHTPFHNIRSQWAKVNAITNPKPSISFPPTLPIKKGDNQQPVPTPPILIDVMRKCLQHDSKARPTVAQLLNIQYVPNKLERALTPMPDIPANILIKVKHTLNEDEWRQLLQILENRRQT